jgi:uncharacterized membrane protein
MQQFLIPGLLWFSAVGCGLLAGLYSAFSAFNMTALGRIGQMAGISAMNAINVPLNNALAAVDPSSPDAASLWARYLTDWTLWNHVRTAASTGACVLFISAIAAK